MSKNNFRVCLLNVLFLVSLAVSSASPLKIIRVGLDKKSFNPSKEEVVTLGFEITRQADVNVNIYDRLGRLVQSFDKPKLEPKRHNIIWDGRGVDDKLATGDVFLYVIEAKTKEGQQAIYNPAKTTGGFETKSLEYTLDRDTGEVEYVLPKACMVRIRAGLKDGIFAKSFFDWKPHIAGRHTYKWDGKDKTGQMYLLKRKELDLRLTSYTLPSNTIIVTGPTGVLGFDNINEFKENQRNNLWKAKGKYLHYTHDPRICHQPRFKMTFPSKLKTDEKGYPVVSGIVPIRIELDSRDVQHLINTRFEIMLFIDGIFLYEIEEGSSPFTFNWNTKKFGKGPHIVTVNLVGYDDHIGIISRKVILGD